MKKRLLFLFLFSLLAASLPAQQLDRLQVPDSVDNVWVKPLSGDSLASSFLIVVKKRLFMY